MPKYVSLHQFTEHHCSHWELTEDGEFCLRFDALIDEPMLDCSPYCVFYDPWDCTIEELLDGEET